ncbi:thiol reductant ABC exporter subunit CydC [Alcaligenes sp. SDU_A2]|uniref:thiol reductant ABC exporter subunit CydC n=1 Tax=Alcaligenes sp. SDU_A2 TaxID=3136634 RepID=UPI00311FC7FC
MKAWLRLLGDSLRDRRGALALTLLLACSTVAAGVGLLGVAGWFLSSAFLATLGIVFNLFGPSALIRGLSFWRIASRYLERIVGHALTLDLQVRIRTRVFARLARFSQGRLAQFRDGELAASLTADVALLDLVLLLLVAPVVTAVLAGLVFSLVLGAWLSWWAWPVLACILLAACLVPYWSARRAAQAARQVHVLENHLRALTHQAVRAYVDIQVFAAKAAVQEQVAALSRDLAQARLHSSAWAVAGQFIQQVLMGIALLVCLLAGAQQVDLHAMSGPVWVGLILALLGLFEIMAPMMRGAARLGEVEAASRRLLTVMDGTGPEENDAGHPLPSEKAAVLRVQQLTFSYGDQRVLQDLNLQVQSGERVALFGPSGSGKSTLLGVLMRLLPVPASAYLIDGEPAGHWARADWYRHCALLAQDSPLFLGSVRDNLLLAEPNATEQRLWQVLRDAQLEKTVRDLPQGLDTWLGEGGQQLSLGQQRRLCLARVLLSPAQIWFLDEPTASLDGPTSQALMRDILLAAGGRTVIMATHDTRLLTLTDHVWQLDGGTLVPVRADNSDPMVTA